MPRWKENGWRTASGEPVKNRAELERLDHAMGGMRDVKFVSLTMHFMYFGIFYADKIIQERLKM